MRAVSMDRRVARLRWQSRAGSPLRIACAACRATSRRSASRATLRAVTGGALAVTWAADSGAFEYTRNGKRFRYDIASRRTVPLGDSPPQRTRSRFRGVPAPDRGRQFDSATSPDGSRKAFYRDRNVWLSAADGSGEIARSPPTAASANRIKYGTASWVYGEELSQRTAIWWSPDGTQGRATTGSTSARCPTTTSRSNQTQACRTRSTPRRIRRPAAPNPVVDLFVYDVATKQSRADRRPRRPAVRQRRRRPLRLPRRVVARRPRAAVLPQNRRQNIMEVVAANPVDRRDAASSCARSGRPAG